MCPRSTTAGRRCSTARRSAGRRSSASSSIAAKATANWRRKRKPPRPIAKDLKQPAEPYLVDIGYRGSGSLRYDFTYAEEPDTQNEHVGADFSWELEWRGVELYDDHYPAGDDTPDINTGQGTWDYSYADSLPGGECTTSGLLQSAFEGTVLVERGAHKGEVDFTVEEPNFLGGMGSCLDRDFWWIASSNLPEAPYPTIRGVPTFPTGPIERPVSNTSCGEIVEPYGTSTCTYGSSATITITPQ